MDGMHRIADVGDTARDRQAGEPNPPDHGVGRRGGLLADQPGEGPVGQPGLPEDRTGQDFAPDLGEVDRPAGLRRQRIGVDAVAEAVAVGIRVGGIALNLRQTNRCLQDEESGVLREPVPKIERASRNHDNRTTNRKRLLADLNELTEGGDRS